MTLTCKLLVEENNEKIGKFKQRHGGAADEETHEAADCGEELPLVNKRLLVDLLSCKPFIVDVQLERVTADALGAVKRPVGL